MIGTVRIHIAAAVLNITDFKHITDSLDDSKGAIVQREDSLQPVYLEVRWDR
jgi:hypothetical protein